jgi:hypothetical protein
VPIAIATGSDFGASAVDTTGAAAAAAVEELAAD